MKTAVVTFVRAYNYGAVLQCYALSKTLKEMGVDVRVLDYYPEYFRKQYSLEHLGKLRIMPNIHIRSWWKNLPVALKIKRRNYGFSEFIQKYIPLTEAQYKTIDELNDAHLGFDAYISGSDQVWNNQCIPFDPTYFLDFSSAKGKKKSSYAASFGFRGIPQELQDTYRELLHGWDFYSVREASGVKILEDLLGVKAAQSCDPTLLLNAEQWKCVAKKNLHQKPYILIYTVNGAQELLDAAHKLADVKGMDVIYVPCVMQHDFLLGTEARKRGFKSFPEASPDEWLALFADAKYVLTDSFHGTVFSLINHKKFMVTIEHKWGKNTRAKELLDTLNISGRFLTNNALDIDEKIDWQDVDVKLQTMREESQKYLKRLMNQRSSNGRD